ncbi:MAG TPA: patatin-like phospholipase family protein [Thermoflexus sp.]|nr:patatin-like phospholipase family protein [Thermoflexus sp.]
MMRRAFVLSGGGNRGPLQVGALRALLERGIEPDFLVGTSAGAINAVAFAVDPTLGGVERLAAAWRRVRRADIYPGNLFTILWRLLTHQDSLFSGSGLRRVLEAHLPPGVRTFGDLRRPCYVTAADLRTQRLILFGEDPSAPLLEAVLASASVPVIHPPVRFRNMQLVDGGVVAVVPITIAVEKGAEELYVLDLSFSPQVLPPRRGLAEIAMTAYQTILSEQTLDDLYDALQSPVTVHHVCMTAFREISFLDFSKTEQMLEAGYEAMRRYLDDPRPNQVCEATAEGIRVLTAQAVPGGGHCYTPLRRRRLLQMTAPKG